MYILVQEGAFRLYALLCKLWKKRYRCTQMSLLALHFLYHGGLAQMVERALCMREVVGSMPESSTKNYFPSLCFFT